MRPERAGRRGAPGGSPGRAAWAGIAGLVALAGLAGACGRVGFDVLDRGGEGDGGLADSSPEDGPGGDAAALGPFGTPVNVTELNLAGTNTEDPTLTDDLLEIYFSSTRASGVGGVDVWTATRAAITDPWGAPVLVLNVNSTSDDTTPEVSGDGLVLLFASNRAGGAGLYDLYQATRASRASTWSAPVRIAELASTVDEFAGSISPDGLTLVFSSSRPGGAGAADIWQATRGSVASTWNAPTPIAELGTTSDDSSPWRSGDGRTMYFSSTRPGGQGDQDVWRSVRATTNDPWSTPVPVTELDDANYDSDPWLSPDQRTIVYSRINGSFRNIFTATR